MIESAKLAWQHFKDRLCEKSTFAGVVGAISGGAALASPFNWLAILAGVVAVLLPTS